MALQLALRSTSLTKSRRPPIVSTRGRQDPPDPSAPPHRLNARALPHLRAPAPGRPAQRPRTRGREEGVHRMALKTPEEFVQSIADLHLQIYLFGEKVDDYVDHPLIRPSINCIAMTYELARAARVRRPHAGHQPPHRQEGQPLHPHPPVAPRTSSKKVKMQRLLGQKTGSLLPALRRHGRHQRPVLGHLRDRPGAGAPTTTSASRSTCSTCRRTTSWPTAP